jgi:hypothetical protein
MIKSSQDISHIGWLENTDVSGTISVPTISVTAMMMRRETFPENSVTFNELTWLISREYFTNFGQLESFRC